MRRVQATLLQVSTSPSLRVPTLRTIELGGSVKQVVLGFVTMSVVACASIMHGGSQDIGISSTPTGAKVAVDNFAGGQTPYIAKLSRKDNHIVKITMDGYAATELTLTKSVSGWVWGNVVFGGIIGLQSMLLRAACTISIRPSSKRRWLNREPRSPRRVMAYTWCSSQSPIRLGGRSVSSRGSPRERSDISRASFA